MESDTNFILAFLDSMNATKWGIIAVLLVGAELLTGTTYVLWIAAAALVMAVVTFLVPMAWELQFLIFTVLSIALLAAGHFYLRPLMRSDEPSDTNNPVRTMVGRRVVAFSDFDNGEGRVTVGDTQWKASSNAENLKSGDKLVVTAVVGATLVVEPAVKA
jgi:membrane protein implicated in regulation of membrane protease activity